MTKLIIIEGADNMGKNLLISKLSECWKHIMLIHCSKPESGTFKQQAMEQDALFYNYTNKIENHVYDCADVVIFNRAWYGEYVYGQMYRGRDPESIKYMINNVEDKLSSLKHIDIKYIQLMSSSLDLVTKNDDGKSLSENNAERVQKELQLFNDIFNYSNVDKKLVYINNNNEFRDIDEIFLEVVNFINS